MMRSLFHSPLIFLLWPTILGYGCSHTLSKQAASHEEASIAQKSPNPTQPVSDKPHDLAYSPSMGLTVDHLPERDAITAYLIGMRAALHQDYRSAYRYFSQNYNHSPSAHTAFKLLAYDPEQLDPTIMVFKAQKMALMYPKDQPIKIFYGNLLRKTGKPKEAKEQYQQAIQSQPSSPLPYPYLLDLLISESQWSEALTISKDFQAQYAHLTDPWLFELKTRIQSANYQGGSRAAIEILERDRDTNRSKVLLAYAYLLENQIDKAVKIYADLQKASKKSVELRWKQTQNYLFVTSFADAAIIFSRVLSSPSLSAPSRGTLIKELMWIYHMDKNLTSLQELLLDHASKHPLDPSMTWLLASTYHNSPSESIRILQKIPRNSPFAMLAAQQIFQFRSAPYLTPFEGRMEKFLGDKELDYAARSLLRFRPISLENLTIISYYFFSKGDYDDALNLLKTGVYMFPSASQLSMLLGFVYTAMDQHDHAEQLFRSLVNKHPLNSDLLNALGYTLATRQKNLDEAELLIKKALEISPDNGAYLDSLGWVYFNKGELDKAALHIQKAHEIRPEDPEILEHLAVIRLHQGDCPKAQSLFDLAYYHATHTYQWHSLQSFEAKLQNSCPQL